MTAYENRLVKWYRVRRLSEADDVISIARLARAMLPSEHAPVGFIVDNVGQTGTEKWDLLVRELAPIPGIHLLGAAREEDLFQLETLPALRLVRLTMDDELAESIHRELRARSQTDWIYWQEPYDRSGGLLLEYLHLLTAGDRLTDVIASQILRRRQEARWLELEILAIAGTAGSWGAQVPLIALVEHLNQPDVAVSAALERLVGEHLVRQFEDGAVGGLHRLRSRAIFSSIHEAPPPTAEASISTTIGLLASRNLQMFVEGLLASDPEMADVVLQAAASALGETIDAEQYTAVMQALRGLEFRREIEGWLATLGDEGVPLGMQSLAMEFAMHALDIEKLEKLFDPRLVSGVRRLRSASNIDWGLRRGLISRLPNGHVAECIVAEGRMGIVASLFASLADLDSDSLDLPSLEAIEGSALARALRSATPVELGDVVATARAVSRDFATTVVEVAGGERALLRKLERETPWCRNMEVGEASSGLLDGRTVEGVDPEAPVARFEYRVVSDELQETVHDSTVDLARRVFSIDPLVEVVRAVAIDAREQPYGTAGLEVASGVDPL